MHSCIFYILGCTFFFFFFFIIITLKCVCFLGNVKALKINDNLKEWNVKLDCKISHHYLGFFFFFWMNHFLCYSLTQYAFSIYNCPFHSWKPLLVLGNFSSCKACLRRRIQGLCGPYVSQPHFLCCIYVCRRCKMQIIRSFILSNPNSMKELRDLVEAPESEVKKNVSSEC
jgi:hypothetical protein